MVVLLSKFLPGQRDSQLLLDSESYSYSSKKDKDNALNMCKEQISEVQELFSVLLLHDMVSSSQQLSQASAVGLNCTTMPLITSSRRRRATVFTSLIWK